MKNKEKILIGVIVVIVGVLIFLLPKNICGPEIGGEGRDNSYCDRSCERDEDCNFVCGCGVININEKCDMGAVLIECEFPPLDFIKCQNSKCVVVLEDEDFG